MGIHGQGSPKALESGNCFIYGLLQRPFQKGNLPAGSLRGKGCQNQHSGRVQPQVRSGTRVTQSCLCKATAGESRRDPMAREAQGPFHLLSLLGGRLLGPISPDPAACDVPPTPQNRPLDKAAAPLNPELPQPHPPASSPFYFFMNEKRSPQSHANPAAPIGCRRPLPPNGLNGARRSGARAGA